MPRITRVTTRSGDDGTTALGSRRRVGKDSLRVEAYGAVDELNSALGLARASALGEAIEAALGAAQNTLFVVGADLCIPEEDKATLPAPVVVQRHLAALDDWIEGMVAALPPLANFVLPGGSEAAARLHLARAICRRAERRVVALAREEQVGELVIPYLNRLSDALFLAARLANVDAGCAERLWESRA